LPTVAGDALEAPEALLALEEAPEEPSANLDHEAPAVVIVTASLIGSQDERCLDLIKTPVHESAAG
jgi:hypothetical protein